MLAAIGEVDALRELERSIATSVAAGRDDASRDIAQGLIALRLYEVGRDRADVRRAREVFERARDSDGSNVWAHYGWALALATEERREARIVTVRAFERAIGLDPLSHARRALQHSLRLDPTFLPAAELLVQVALELRDREALAEARDALRAASAAPGSDAGVHLALSRAAAALGDLDLAAEAATAAIRRSVEASAEARRALAIALLPRPEREEEGARAYFDAVDGMTPSLASALVEDIALIARNAERKQWEALPLDERGAWLRRFWELRAATAGVTVHERLGEHYRRLAAAWERYPRRIRWGAPPRNALLLDRIEAPFDDRGVILVRHGEPIEVIRTLDPSLPQNESWVYPWFDGRLRTFHFANYGSVLDADRASGDGYAEWLLIYDVPCGGSYAADRMLHDARFVSLSRRCDTAERRTRSAEIRQDAYEALRSDTDRPDFTRDLTFAYRLYTFRAPDHRTELVAGFALARNAADSLPASLRISLIVADTAEGAVARHDTTLVAGAAGRAPATLVGFVSVRAMPTRAAVHRILLRDAVDPDRGRLRGGPLFLPNYSGDTLMISDVVLATPAAAADDVWPRANVRLSPVPSGQLDSGDFQLFYEIYNLPARARYSTEITVESTGGGVGRRLERLFGGHRPIRLRFEEEAATPSDTTLRELRRIQAALEPGDYRLRIHVSSQDVRGNAVRELRLLIRRPPH